MTCLVMLFWLFTLPAAKRRCQQAQTFQPVWLCNAGPCPCPGCSSSCRRRLCIECICCCRCQGGGGQGRSAGVHAVSEGCQQVNSFPGQLHSWSRKFLIEGRFEMPWTCALGHSSAEHAVAGLPWIGAYVCRAHGCGPALELWHGRMSNGIPAWGLIQFSALCSI